MEEKALKVLVVDDNPADIRIVQEMLAEEPGAFDVSSAESLMTALDALAHRRFDVALVDLSLTDSQGLATFETIQRHAGQLPIVVFTGVSNESLALTAVARGAQDYLVKGKMTSHALVRVLRYSMARRRNSAQYTQEEQARAPIVGFLGVKGGVGTTTLAAHFAVAWKRRSNKNVLLIDMDTTSASSQFLVKTDARYSILDASTNLHRLDVEFWNRVATQGPHGIDVLLPPGALSFGEQLSTDRVRHVLRFARPLYQCIVADLGCLSPLALSLLEEVSTLYVISTTELPSFSAASRVLKKLMQLQLSQDQIRLVFNRAPKSFPDPTPDLEKALGYVAYGRIGDFSAELNEAYGSGRMLDENLSFHKQVAQMVAKSMGVQPKADSSRLLGFFRRVVASA